MCYRWLSSSRRAACRHSATVATNTSNLKYTQLQCACRNTSSFLSKMRIVPQNREKDQQCTARALLRTWTWSSPVAGAHGKKQSTSRKKYVDPKHIESTVHYEFFFCPGSPFSFWPALPRSSSAPPANLIVHHKHGKSQHEVCFHWMQKLQCHRIWTDHRKVHFQENGILKLQ